MFKKWILVDNQSREQITIQHILHLIEILFSLNYCLSIIKVIRKYDNQSMLKF